jgi:hypothetical protein
MLKRKSLPSLPTEDGPLQSLTAGVVDSVYGKTYFLCELT